jgi:hypothetical protein
MKEFKHKSIFSSEIKALISEETDKHLALAAIERIGEFVPDIDTEKNMDLLPIAFNAFVVNRANKNGDVIDTETALRVSKSFINKPINIEHGRDKVIGVILTVGYSEFGTDRPLTEEEVKDSESPFNVALGGVLWKLVNRDIADLVEKAGDPSDEDYLKISASWELGFNQYQLVITNGDRNIRSAEIVADEEKITELEKNLKAFGGTGILEDGRHVYRQVVGDVLPLGIGLTETPAADVKGVFVKKKKKKKEDYASDDAEQVVKSEIVKEDNSSQRLEINVKKVYNNSESTHKLMKINSINEITDESLKELTASAISDFIQEELKNASEKFVAERNEVGVKLDSSEKKHDALSKDHETMKQELDKVQTDLEALQEEKAEKEKQETFNERMSQMDEEYELDDEDRKVIASDIREMDEENFESYSKKMNVLLKDKSKAALTEKAKLEAENLAKTEVKAEPQEEVETVEETVEKVLDEAEADNNHQVPASTMAKEATVYEKYASAFGLDQFEISEKRK